MITLKYDDINMNILTFILGVPIRAVRAPVNLSADLEALPQLQAYYDKNIAPISRKYET